ncbi:MAG: 4-hydroxy-tetrahydrodipicolinate reductase, partial [Bacteroidia bacterium]|nr:4-hydroxy-tetrahydrodipicolinate reductase [Bacteroidia bacterium]
MRIALIGYGKMGKTIEKMAMERGHKISHRIDVANLDTLPEVSSDNTDVAIEFTQPASAFDNIRQCLEHGVPVVSGTTGWLGRWADVEQICHNHQGAFFYASNYSIGVNLFFRLNKYLAAL